MIFWWVVGLPVFILKEDYYQKWGAVVVQFRKPEIHTLLTVNEILYYTRKFISQCFVNTLDLTKTDKCVFLSLYLQGNDPPSPTMQTPETCCFATGFSCPPWIFLHKLILLSLWKGKKKNNLPTNTVVASTESVLSPEKQSVLTRTCWKKSWLYIN